MQQVAALRVPRPETVILRRRFLHICQCHNMRWTYPLMVAAVLFPMMRTADETRGDFERREESHSRSLRSFLRDRRPSVMQYEDAVEKCLHLLFLRPPLLFRVSISDILQTCTLPLSDDLPVLSSVITRRVGPIKSNGSIDWKTRRP